MPLENNVLHTENRDKLFPHAPTVDDIRQSGIGDCYFLSAITSILARPDGADIVEKMFQEYELDDQGNQIPLKNAQGNPIIRVHFYNESGEKFSVDVERTLRVNPLKHPFGPAWVSFLEKAYAQAFHKGDYAAIEGGLAGDALTQMLGEPHQYQLITNSDPKKLYELHAAFKSSDSAMQLSDAEKKIWQAMLDNPKYKLKEKWDKALKKQQWVANDVTKSLDLVPSPDEARHMMRAEDLKKMLFHEKMTDQERAVANRMLAWTNEKPKILPGKRGTGEYTQEQEQLYAQLQEKLADKFSITASTHKRVTSKFQLVRTEQILPSGEQTSKGLVGSHAYAVLGCEEIDGVKYVKVRNPWGHYGREYQKKDGVLQPTAKRFDSTSYIELSDFCKRFEDVSAVGFYLTIKNGPIAANITPDKVPGYVLADNGLYFVTKKEAMLEAKLVTNDLDKIASLKASLTSLAEGTRRLEISERLAITEKTGSTLPEEARFANGQEYLYTAPDLSKIKIDRAPAFILTENGLYQISMADVLAGKTLDALTESDRLVSDPDLVKHLWRGLKGNETPVVSSQPLTPNSAQLNLLKNEIKPNYSYDSNSTLADRAYMEKYQLNDNLIKKFTDAVKELINTGNVNPLTTLKNELTLAQIKGLTNLTIQYGNAPNAPSGKCLELVNKFGLPSYAARVNPVLKTFETSEITTPVVVDALQNKFKADPKQTGKSDFLDYVKQYDLNLALVMEYRKAAKAALKDGNMAPLNALKGQINFQQRLGLANLSVEFSNAQGPQTGKLFDLVKENFRPHSATYRDIMQTGFTGVNEKISSSNNPASELEALDGKKLAFITAIQRALGDYLSATPPPPQHHEIITLLTEASTYKEKGFLDLWVIVARDISKMIEDDHDPRRKHAATTALNNLEDLMLNKGSHYSYDRTTDLELKRRHFLLQQVEPGKKEKATLSSQIQMLPQIPPPPPSSPDEEKIYRTTLAMAVDDAMKHLSTHTTKNDKEMKPLKEFQDNLKKNSLSEEELNKNLTLLQKKLTATKGTLQLEQLENVEKAFPKSNAFYFMRGFLKDHTQLTNANRSSQSNLAEQARPLRRGKIFPEEPAKDGYSRARARNDPSFFKEPAPSVSPAENADPKRMARTRSR